MTKALPPVDALTQPVPAELAWIAEHLGAIGALKLIEAFGGVRIYVPRKPPARSPLAHALGLADARRLAAAYGGDTIKVPLARAWRLRLYRDVGMSYAEIARKLGMTQEGVQMQLQRAGMTNRESRQAELPL